MPEPAMIEDRRCPQCGTSMPPGRAEGLCPKCLLSGALQAPDECRLQIRCPHCQCPVEIVDDPEMIEVTCPSCHSSINLIGDRTVTFVADAPTTLGRFELLDRLGIGAFGSVWKARDPHLDRIVAVKIPRKGQLSPEEAELFLREARATAQLRHPHIVSVHEVGREGDAAFIVSDFVEGVTLADFLTAQRPAFREAAGLCAKIAAGLQHAHDAGVVHRDLKPSNILLDKSREPHITDFGLAKREAAEITMTVDGKVLGTPAYMSPEQARGEGHHADRRSDVYSLGVVLFELLTGERPFRGNSRMLLHQVIHDDAPSPRKLNGAVPRDLETICLKCLEKEPPGRYQTARAVADELQRFLRGEPILARPISRWERAWRWSRRNPLPSSLAVGLAVAILLGFAGVTWKWRDAEWQSRLARDRADESRNRLVRQYVANGATALDQHDPLRGLVWFAEALRQDAGDARREDMHRRRLGTIGRQTPRLMHALVHDEPVDAAGFSPDGNFIATISKQKVGLWDAQTGELRAPLLTHDDQVWRAVFSPDSRLLAVLVMPPNLPGDESHFGTVHVYETRKGNPVCAPARLRGLTRRAAFTPQGQRLFVVAADKVHAFGMDIGTEAFAPLEHPQDVHALELSPDGRRLLTWCGLIETRTHHVRLYDAADGRLLYDGPDEQRIADEGAFAPDSRHFATFSYDWTGGRGNFPGNIRIHEADSGRLVGQPRGTPVFVEQTAFTADGTRIIAHLKDGRLFAGETGGTGALEPVPNPSLRGGINSFAVGSGGDQLLTVRRDQHSVTLEVANPWGFTRSAEYRFDGWHHEAAFSPDGRRVVLSVTGADVRRSDVHLIDLNSREISTLAVAHQYGVLTRLFSPDGRSLLTWGDDGAARVWDLTGFGPALSGLEGLEDRGISCLALAPDGRRLAVGQGHHDMQVDRGGDTPYGYLRVWELDTGKPVGPRLTFGSRVDSIDFGDDDRRAAVTLSDGSAAVVDVVTGETLFKTAYDPEWRVNSAVLGAGRRLVTYATGAGTSPDAIDKAVARIEIRTGIAAGSRPQSIELEPHDFLALSPDGDRFLIVAKTGEAQVRSILSPQPSVPLGRMHRIVKAAAFRPDGRRLAIVFEDQLAGIWDVATGRLATPYLRNVGFARFSQDGRFLLTGNEREPVRIWDAATAEPISLPINTQQLVDAPRLDAVPVFGPNAESLVSTAGDRLRIWDLSADDRAVPDLVLGSVLAAGYHIDEVGGYAPADGTRLKPAWTEYASRFPAQSRRPPAEQVRAWQRREAWSNEMHAAREIGRNSQASAPPHWHAARFHLDPLIGPGPADPALHRRRARALAGQSRQGPVVAQALADYDLALARGLADDAEVWFERSDVLHRLGREAEAAECVARALELGSNADRSGLESWQKPAAAAGLSRLIARRPDDRDLLYRRAELYWDTDDWQRGIEDYSRLIGLGGDTHWLHYRRGDCLAGLGRWDEAVVEYTQALGEKLDDPSILTTRAGALAFAGQFVEALADLDRARPLVAYQGEIIHDEALIRLLAGDEAGYRKACASLIEYFESHIEPGPIVEHLDGDRATRLAGTCTLGSRGIADAALLVALAEKGARAAPADFQAVRTLGAALYRAGQFAAAVETLTQAAALNEDALTPWLLLALAHHQLGNADESRTWLEKAVRRMDAEPHRLPWENWAILTILKNEAQKVSGTDKATTGPER